MVSAAAARERDDDWPAKADRFAALIREHLITGNREQIERTIDWALRERTELFKPVVRATGDPISALPILASMATNLEKHGIKTVQDALRRKPDQIQALRYVGRKTVAELAHAFDDAGFALPRGWRRLLRQTRG
jgi:hypothetical protein